MKPLAVSRSGDELETDHDLAGLELRMGPLPRPSVHDAPGPALDELGAVHLAQVLHGAPCDRAAVVVARMARRRTRSCVSAAHVHRDATRIWVADPIFGLRPRLPVPVLAPAPAVVLASGASGAPHASRASSVPPESFRSSDKGIDSQPPQHLHARVRVGVREQLPRDAAADGQRSRRATFLSAGFGGPHTLLLRFFTLHPSPGIGEMRRAPPQPPWEGVPKGAAPPFGCKRLRRVARLECE